MAMRLSSPLASLPFRRHEHLEPCHHCLLQRCIPIEWETCQLLQWCCIAFNILLLCMPLLLRSKYVEAHLDDTGAEERFRTATSKTLAKIERAVTKAKSGESSGTSAQPGILKAIGARWR